MKLKLRNWQNLQREREYIICWRVGKVDVQKVMKNCPKKPNMSPLGNTEKHIVFAGGWSLPVYYNIFWICVWKKMWRRCGTQLSHIFMQRIYYMQMSLLGNHNTEIVWAEATDEIVVALILSGLRESKKMDKQVNKCLFHTFIASFMNPCYEKIQN